MANVVEQLRELGRRFKSEVELLRIDAKDKELRASERYDAFISIDLLADKIEKQLQNSPNPNAAVPPAVPQHTQQPPAERAAALTGHGDRS